jgi:hypothetical protein
MNVAPGLESFKTPGPNRDVFYMNTYTIYSSHFKCNEILPKMYLVLKMVFKIN